MYCASHYLSPPQLGVRCLNLPVRGCWGKLPRGEVLGLREMLLCESDTLDGVVVMLICKTCLSALDFCLNQTPARRQDLKYRLVYME